MIQLKTHFKYLKLGVQELILNAKEDFCADNALESCSAYDIQWPYHQKQFKKIVLHYNYVIQVAKVTESVFNKCVLVSFINLSILICLILLNLSNVPAFSIQWLKLWSYIAAVCVLFFADCYFTQMVITENETFAYSFYEIDFVGICLTFQKSLILCMARAQKPVKFTIGKFAPPTVVAIVTVLKASYSYYTLLQSRRKH
ncbi:odorant receptor Or2-like [Photinus pyralis]|uniref:odorant receptor Or2-like n=1 Tax=Photinus pyralis TaxID=7054 RepID=UPI00126746C5|nr:odorant receptor Or2-like [Photinus pyralis]